MRLLILALVSGLLHLPALQSQTFTRNYGGAGNELARWVVNTPDSGFAMLGTSSTYSNGSNDLYLVRTDKYGDTLWTRNFGGVANEISASVDLCPDSGFIVAGTTSSFGTGTPTYTNWYVIRTDKYGDTIWTRTYGPYSNDLMFNARANSDGTFILMGYHDIGGFATGTIIKTNAAGYPLWTNYISSGSSFAYESMELPGGDYITCGSTFSGTFNAVLQKFSSNGALLLSKSYHSSGQYADAAFSIVPALHGGFMVLGIYGNYGSYNIWLLRVDDNLDTLWTRKLPGYFSVGQLWTKDVSISRVSDGYVLCGSGVNSGHTDLKLMKVDSLGNHVWTKFVGGSGEQYGYKAITTPDNGLAACGFAIFPNNTYDFFLVKTDSAGNIAPPNPPLVFAGVNGQVCEGGSFHLAAATASNYNTLRWTGNGSGHFSDSTVLNPYYIPSQADISAGTVILTLQATASGYTPVVSSCTLTIHPLPVIQILGLDTSYCLVAQIVAAQGLPSGGSFSGTVISPGGVFSLVAAGLGNHVITYSYTNPSTGCSAADSMGVTIYATPSIALPMDTSLCAGSWVLLDAGANHSAYLWSNGDTTQSVMIDSASNGLTPFQVWVKVWNEHTCVASDTMEITFHANPILALPTDTSLCAGSSLLLNAGANHSGHLWSNGDTAQSVMLDSSGHGLAPFHVWVRVWNQHYCSASDTMQVQFVDCSALPEQSAGLQVLAWPNPFGSALMLKVLNAEASEGRVYVHDMRGRLVHAEVILDNPAVLDLQHLPGGIYLISCISGESINHLKVVKR